MMKGRKYSPDIANAIRSFLTEDNWHFMFDEQMGLFRFSLGLREGIKKIDYIVDVKEDEYIVYAFSPISADSRDSSMMAAMAEFICRANYGLINGNFELDFRDGEIRYKSFVDCDGEIVPPRDTVKNSIYCTAIMFKRYAPGITGIVFAGLSAKEAIEKCEGVDIMRLASMFSDDDDEADSDASSSETQEEDHVNVDLFGVERIGVSSLPEAVTA